MFFNGSCVCYLLYNECCSKLFLCCIESVKFDRFSEQESNCLWSISVERERELNGRLKGFWIEFRVIISQKDFRQCQLHTRTVVVTQDSYYSSSHDYNVFPPIPLRLQVWTLRLPYVINLSAGFILYRPRFDVILPTITHTDSTLLRGFLLLISNLCPWTLLFT